MLYNDTVGIYNRSPNTKVNGITIQGNSIFVRDIECDMQPYSKELLIKSYGYDIPCTKRFFMDYSPDIKIGTILKHGDDRHEVKKIIDWDYLEVFTLEVS